ncbi:MAG: radical SAM protein [Tissierellia bacterium]|nr:radical SAM protein [Tissierellia bacterium]
MEFAKHVIQIKNNKSVYYFNLFNGLMININDKNINKKEYKYLEENNFLKKDNEVFFYSLKKQNTLGITIEITRLCNLQCDYCYNNNNSIKANITKIKSKISDLFLNFKNRINRVYVTYTGGEPLMDFESVLEIHNYINHECNKRNLYLDENILTNGIFLNEEILIILKNNNINNMQVSLGSYIIKQDKLMNEYSLDSILSGIKNAQKFLNITVRINFDLKFSMQDIRWLIELVKRYDIKHIYFAMVEDNGRSPYFIKEDEYIDFFNKIWNIMYSKNMRFYEKLPPVHSLCMAKSKYSIYLTSEGEIRKCMCTNNTKNINKTSKVFDIDKYIKYRKNICINCSYELLCLGGCLFLEKNDSTVCKKSLFEKLIPLYIKYKFKIMEGEKNCLK